MMRLLFKQRFFSWFDSYDIYNEDGDTVFTVKGRLDWGHRLEIYDRNGHYLGKLKEKVFTFLPRFEMYIQDRYVGQITKEFTFFKPVFSLDCNGWKVSGDWLQWDYHVEDSSGRWIMSATKELLNLTDTYSIEIADSKDSLISLMIVLAIDAAKCSASSRH